MKAKDVIHDVSILALGNWGTALANYLALRGHRVVGWTKDERVANEINSRHRNPEFLSDIILDEKLVATTELSEALKTHVVIVVCPAASIPSITPLLKLDPGTVLVSAIKGFEAQSLLTPLQYFEEKLGKHVSYVVLSGPSFAHDIVRGKPAGIVSASKNEESALLVANLFAGGTLKVYISEDPLGVEIGGAVKNVIALAAGVSDGLSLGDSARAGLITRGLAEMIRLGEVMGADPRTLTGLSGLGDLVMTATCDISRNRTAGFKLGRGGKLQKILEEIGSAVEGVHTTPIVLELGRRHGVELPITSEMAKLLRGESTAFDAVKSLLTRPMKREID